MKEVVLPSGAKLKVAMADFSTAKALYKAVAEEFKKLKIDGGAEVDYNFFKDILCSASASDNVEAKLWPCMEKCLYNGKKIVPDTFEPADARQDFLDVCFYVGKENLYPFTKHLYAKFETLLKMVNQIDQA